jgi:2-phosphosulfolactate phosphatase
VRVHVAFTPAEAAEAPTGIVVDVLRATSTIAQALASGYRRVLCCAEVEEARALRAAGDGVVLAGERLCVRIPGFDLGNSPREFLEPRGETLVLTTTNGTRAIVAAAERCERVLTGSLLNLAAVVGAARAVGGDVAILCAGVKGAFVLDDAYCAGRIVELLGGEPSDAATAAVRIARSFDGAVDGLAASQSARNLLEGNLEDDISWCAQESVLDAVPRFVGMHGSAAEIAS